MPTKKDNIIKAIMEIVNLKRETVAEFHLMTATAWRKIGQNELKHTPLSYAAFEYRCAIERVVFELYFLMKGATLTKEEASSIGSFKSLIELVHLFAGGSKKELYLTLKFNQIYVSELFNINIKLSIPDVGKLHNHWSKLSEYCHRQLMPSETWGSQEWLSRGYKLLERVENYLWDIIIENHFGSLEIQTLPAMMIEQRDLFLSGNLSESALRMRLRIIKPMIDSRTK